MVRNVRTYGLVVFGNACLLKLLTQPDSLLLEAQRSKTSGKNDNQTFLLTLINPKYYVITGSSEQPRGCVHK